LTTEVTVQAGVVAFARVLGDRAVVFAAPRLSASVVTEGMVAPIGADSWKTSRIMLPAELAERTFRHEVTGAEIKPMVTGTDAWLFAGQVFQLIPVGILRTV
jgi:maltooligosyltrehalose synthase